MVSFLVSCSNRGGSTPPSAILFSMILSSYSSSLSLLDGFSSIFVFFLVSLLLSVVVFGLSFFFSSKSLEKEKVSAYECGFNPFEDARHQFDVRFYLVAILFIIFDLEVSFLFP